MKTLQHTPANDSYSTGKNLIVTIVFAATVVAVVLMLYFVNSYNSTKKKANTADSLKTTSALQVIGAGKEEPVGGWETKPSPLKMIQFIQ